MTLALFPLRISITVNALFLTSTLSITVLADKSRDDKLLYLRLIDVKPVFVERSKEVKSLLKRCNEVRFVSPEILSVANEVHSSVSMLVNEVFAVKSNAVKDRKS